MQSGTSRRYRRASIRLAKLFCSASVAAMAAGGAAARAQGQQVAQEDIPETVLITGSLISGAVSVGVPVSSLRTLDFVETGQLSLTDVLKSIPSLDVDAQSSPIGALSHSARSEIAQRTRVASLRHVDELLVRAH